MTPARYLVRFDDICETMNWRIWDAIEPVLIEHDVKPLLAVVPDNRDPDLTVAPVHAEFWRRVAEWQRRGWTIGMHGYQHRFHTKESGLIGLNAYSEFAGLPVDAQTAAIGKSLEIFRRHGIEPKVWVAPAHSFDANTLIALRQHGLSTISDGLGFRPFRDDEGLFWIPQQLWRFRRMPFGTWTVCLHHNGWAEARIASFRGEIATYRSNLTSVEEIQAEHGHQSRAWVDSSCSHLLLGLIRLKRFATRINA